MNWIAITPALIGGLAILFIPGLITGYFIGLRQLWLWAIAPLITVTTIATASFVIPFIAVTWNLTYIVIFTALFSGFVILLFKVLFKEKLLFPKHETTASDNTTPESTNPDSTRATISLKTVTVLSALAAITIIASFAIIGIGSPTNISQTFDNIFHLNLIEYTLDKRVASPFQVGAIVSENPGFYPNAWHSLVSIVTLLTGASVPVAVNVTNLALIVVWVLGILLFVRQLFGYSKFVVITAAIIATAFPAAPLNLIRYGVIYPYFLAVLLVPAALAVLANFLNIGAIKRGSSYYALGLLLLGLVPGIAVSHPAAIMAVLALAVPMVTVTLFYNFSKTNKQQKLFRITAYTGFVIVGYLMLLKLRPSFASVRGPKHDFLSGLKQTLLLDFFNIGLPIFLCLVMLIGLIVLGKEKTKTSLTIIAMWAVGALLFFVSAGVPFWKFRVLTVGVWYADNARLAAIYVITLIPVIVAGITFLRKQILAKKFFTTKSSNIITAAFIVVTLLLSQLGSGFHKFLTKMHKSYAYTDESVLISSNEKEMFEKLPELVEEDATIVGSPWTGTSLAYALAGRQVLMPHIFTTVPAEKEVLLISLNDKSSYPELCEILVPEKIKYVLDFGDLEVHEESHPYEGLENLDTSQTVELIERVGEARLFEITACDF